MDPHSDPLDARAPFQTSTLDVEFSPAGGRFAAVVWLCGEHDLATASALRETLGSIHGNVLVDLTRCNFIDSTIIGTLVEASRAMTRDGFALETVVPSTSVPLRRIFDVAGLDRLLVVHAVSPLA
jgi:anti-anti-sigma factor